MQDVVTKRARAEEQRHLDETYAAYEALLAALSGNRRAQRRRRVLRGGARADAARAAARVHAASGPLYFGRIDRDGGAPLYIGRHAVADEHNELLAINWRAPAAEPFYAATPAAPARAHAPPPPRHRGPHGRRATSTSGWPRAAELHLTEAIVEDITRRRVGEMRQIISTITPEQYELIARRVGGALVVQGGPGTGKTAVGLHRAAWLLYADPALARAGVLVVGPEPHVHRLHLAGAAVARRAERGAAPDRRARLRAAAAGAASRRSMRRAARQRPDGGAARRGCCGSASARPSERREVDGRPRAPSGVEPDEVAALIADARERRRAYQAARERFRDRLADRSRRA